MSPNSLQLLLATVFILLCILFTAVSATQGNSQPLYLNPAPPATIPAFPEQSDVEGCPLDLSNDLFHALKSACPAPRGNAYGQVHRTRCCPVLAAWLYAAYSTTALGRSRAAPVLPGRSPAYDMPLLPDDSETCVDGLGKALRERGIQLAQPNETCDVVYCYCGIRLHPLSCPEAFYLTQNGKLDGSESVKRLERDCLSESGRNGFPGLNGCSRCLSSLRLLNQNTSASSKSADRTTKMHNKDCQLMGLTWLLSKNRTAYIHTVSNVLRAIMMNPDDSDPQSCTLSSDGLPLAVDSSEISDSYTVRFTTLRLGLLVLSLCLLYHVLAL